MNRYSLAAAFAASISLSAPGFAALPQRTFVASNGGDTFACTLAAPCRGFAKALTQTRIDGEIIVLDSAGYGPVTITLPVSIIAPPGVYAGISASTTDGVTINAPGGNVVLRGLSINGLGGSVGVNVVSAAEVHLENLVISNLSAQGVLTLSSGTLSIKDSILRDNQGDGIAQYAGNLIVEHVRSEQNGGRELYVQAGTTSVEASTFQRNFVGGFRVDVERSRRARRFCTATWATARSSAGVAAPILSSRSTAAWSMPMAPTASKRMVRAAVSPSSRLPEGT